MFRITMLPAEDGDCLLIETGEDAAPHRILIDGGRKRTGTQVLHNDPGAGGGRCRSGAT